ncbi:hypothetical protein [Bifidobacterium stellenboschense]|uniref:AbiEi antitoxin C-terminal domain-containing protein n=1 Tax=Bifidobacterium stellenboschense TaxID=762211 RepID=A0A087DJN4_9BIFI|nr:hypothetical protein [Bifidobacterium stellenboschense]KFI95734.1 hypothetical protein BSTEL_0540 [Bifidobacterium stellenboschense]
MPTILRERDLPGPMSLGRLAAEGTITTLDDMESGYWSEHAATLYGRASIVHRIIPHSTAACALTAMWVWMGGEFPRTLDVLSRSHFRMRHFGHRVRAFTRKVTPRHLVTIGNLRVTDPTRTACDVASLHATAAHPNDYTERIVDLMDAYDFTPDDCATILDENPCMSTMPRTRACLSGVRRSYDHRHVDSRRIDRRHGDSRRVDDRRRVGVAP